MIVQLALTVPAWASVLESTVVVLLVPLKPPVTITKALVLFTGTATALRPVRAVGSDVVVAHAKPLGLNVRVCTMLRVTPLLVPPAVTTVTVTVPGSVKELVPLPDGTVTTIPVSDHPEAFGTTEAVMPVEAWVKTTLPGALRKPLPFISIGSPTGLEGSVELLIFKIEGTASGGVLDPPPEPPEQATKSAAAVTMMAAPTAIAHFWVFVFIFGVS